MAWDADRIIDIMMNDSQDNGKIYRSQPIVRRASQLDVPEKIAQMRRINASPYQLRFLRQAEFMTDYEDSFVYKGEFNRFFPTYQDMNNEQIRGYFTWRARLRKGHTENAPLGFALVYLSELIGLVGVDNEIDGYNKIVNFSNEFKNINPAINSYACRWRNDYAAYYNISGDISRVTDDGCSPAVLALQHMYELSDEELFNAVSEISGYNITRSKLYSSHRQMLVKAVAAVLRGLSDHFGKKSADAFCRYLFGRLVECPYNMFDGAAFYDTRRYENYEYFVTPVNGYICRKGLWYTKRFFTGPSGKKLGGILRVTDSVLREEIGEKPLQYEPISKAEEKIIRSIVKKSVAEDNKPRPVEISLDMTKLDGIRKSADVTRDMLMTEEESEDNNTAAAEKTFSEGVNEEGVNECGAELIKILLSCGDANAFARERHVMLSVICEEINEGLFDRFGDNVIEFDGDVPYIIEDYRGELAELFDMEELV